VITKRHENDTARSQCATFAVADGVDKEQLMKEKYAEMSANNDDSSNLRSRRDAQQEDGSGFCNKVDECFF
jgi:hypothetical protein